jgi:hypothetical protein
MCIVAVIAVAGFSAYVVAGYGYVYVNKKRVLQIYQIS